MGLVTFENHQGPYVTLYIFGYKQNPSLRAMLQYDQRTAYWDKYSTTAIRWHTVDLIGCFVFLHQEQQALTMHPAGERYHLGACYEVIEQLSKSVDLLLITESFYSFKGVDAAS